MSRYIAYLKKMMLFFVLLFVFAQDASATNPTITSTPPTSTVYTSTAYSYTYSAIGNVGALGDNIYIDTSGSYNKDVILNTPSGQSADSVNDAVDSGTGTYFTEGYYSSGDGLPNNGIFANTSYHPYIKLAYDNNNNGYNAIKHISSSTNTFNVSTNKYEHVHVFALAGNGDTSTLKLKLYYSDGTTVTTSEETVPDWFTEITESTTKYYVINNLDRWDGGNFHDANDPAIFGFKFPVDSSKYLTKFDIISTISSGQSIVIFGANVSSGTLKGDVTSAGYDAVTWSVESKPSWLTNTGATLTGTPTAPGNYNVSLKATTASGGTTYHNFTITVANRAPTDIALSATSLNSLADINTTIGTISATDADAGDTKTYSMCGTGANDSNFIVSGTTLKSNAKIDYLSVTTQSICIKVTDTAGASYTENFTIAINPVTYAITYNANGGTGTVPSAQTKHKDHNITLVATNSGNLVKTNSKFLGWNTLSNGTGINYSANNTFVYSTNAILTLYAKWQINPTITFATNGGNTITAVQIESGTKVTKPSDPTKAGYSFVGWYKDSGLTIEFDFDNVITANTTLYAKWTPNIYTISYDANEAEVGSVPSATSKTHDINVLVATNSGALQKAGFKFVEWNTLADGSGVDYNVSSTYSTNSNTTLFAKWSAVVSNNTAPEFDIEGGGDISMVLNKMVAGDRAASDYFGYSVSISGDTAIVGARNEDEDVSGANTFTSAGSAYIFTKQSNGTWTQTQKIVASDRAESDFFGTSVSISGDTAIVGAYQEAEDASGINTQSTAGSAYIFKKQTDGTWIQKQKIVASDRATSDYFGWSVAISGDTAIVGAYGDNEDVSGTNMKADAGSAYIFTEQSNGTWTQTQKIVAGDRSASDNFGYSVSISGDTTIVGAYYEDEDASGINTFSAAGSAYIFTKQSNGTWTQTQKIVAGDRAGSDYFGYKVSISGDAAIVAAYGEDEDASGTNMKADAGSAYIFTKQTNGTWTQAQKIVAGDRAGSDFFGVSVAISGDTAIVGAYQEDEDASGANTKPAAGSVYKFTKQTDGTWSQTQKIVASDRAGLDYFGYSVAIDGNNTIVGAIGEDEDASGGNTKSMAGSVYIESTGASTPSYTIEVNENSKVAFQAVAIDEGDIITYSINGTDAGLFDINSTTGVITFKTKPNYEIPTDSGANNVYEFVVSASDGTNTTEINAQVTVKNVAVENYAPVISSLSNYEKPEDFSDFNVSIGLGDTEEDTINLTLTNSNPNLISVVANYTNPLEYNSYSMINPTITIDSVADIYGQSQITLKVTDSKGLSSSKSFTVNVPAVIDFPTMATPSVELNEDFGTFELKLTGIDLAGAANANVVTTLADDTNITLSTPNLTITGNEAIISFASIENKFGTTDANITVTANGQSISKIVHITVTNVNDAPSITTTPTTGAENSLYSWTPTVVDVDNTSFSYTANGLPSWATLDTATGIISGTPSYEASGITTILYSVNDGNLSANYDMNITVANTNRIPTDISLSTTTIIENSTMDIDFPYILTTDLDMEDTHSYSLCGGADDSAFDVSSGKLVPLNPFNYEAKNGYSVCIRTTDDKNAIFDKTFTIAVEDAIENFAISFDPNGADTGAVDSQIRVEDLNLTLTDEGNLSRVSYNFIGWNTQADGSGTSYSSSDIYNLDTDITLYAQWEFFNTPPVFSSTPITTATEDTTYNYTLGATDVNSFDKLAFAGKNLPNWLSVQPLSSQTVLVAGQNASGYIDGNGATAKFKDMTGMVKDTNGNFYVADYGNHCIRKIDTANNVTTFAGVCTSYGFVNDANRSLAKFYYPTDIVIDSQGNFFVTDANNNAIRKISVDGSVSTFAGGSSGATDGTGTLAKFSSPQFLTIDKEDTLYLSDWSNHTIRKITKEGVVTTLAGTAGSKGNVDGVGTAAKFYKPRSIAINSQGVLYVVDSFNKAIRTIATDGTVETFKSGLAYNAVGIDSNDVVYYALGTAIYKLDANKVAKQISTSGTVTYPTKILFDGNSIYYPNSVSLHTIYKIEGSGYKLTGKPTNDNVGENNVTVVVNDGTDTTEQNFTITVANTNDFPTIAAQSFITSENNATGSLVGKVVANDVDVGDSLTYSFISGNENGDFAINSTTGEITIAKPLNAYLASKYSLATKVTDESGVYTSAFVTVTIADEADAPVAVADSGSINEDENVTINLARNDTDRDNNLNWGSIVLKTQPTNGTVKIDTLGVASYTPNKDFNGADSFSYLIYDKTGLESNEANVTIIVNPINDAPVAKGATLYTQEDTNLSIVMGNYASDVDMDELTTTIVTSPTHGTLSLEDGIYTFVPTTNFYGFDKFTYKVNDGSLDSATQTIYINVAEINDIPVAQYDDANISEDTSVNINVLANDIDDNALNTNSVAILNQPANGTVAVQSNGTITYTPNLNFFGSDSFSYTVEDDGVATGTQGTGVLISNEAIVNITINPINDAPVLVASDVNMSEDDTMRINLIANASDVDNILDGNISIETNPTNGTIDILENGVIVYNPTANWNGTDSFTYKVSDGELWSNEVTMTLNVANVNDAPSLSKLDDVTKDEDFANFALTINGQDIDSSTLTYSATSSDTTIANVSMSGNLLTISSVANAYGNLTIDINVSDGNLTITRNFELNVTGVDDAPIFTQISSKTFNEDGVFEMNLVASDIEGQTITYTASSSDNTKATVSIVNGKLVVTPLADAFGSITVEVNATANGLTTIQTFEVVIEAVNDAPVMQTINNLIVYKDSGDRNITIGATDIDSANLTYTAVATNSDLVSLIWNGNTLKVTPKETQVGNTNITVMVSDGDKNTTKTFSYQVISIVTDESVKGSGEVIDTNESVTVRFEADDITIIAPKIADENGTITQTIKTGDFEVVSKSELIGTTVALTQSGVKQTYENNITNLKVEVDGMITGEAKHMLDINGTQITATSEIHGAKTTVKKDENDKIIIETKVTDSSNTVFDVIAKEDGTASHKVTLSNGNESTATSKIKGAQTTIKQTGGVETEVINKPTTCTGEYVKAIVDTFADGKAFTKFIQYNCTDDSEIGEMKTISETTLFAPKNNVTIESNNGSTQIITVTPLEDDIRF